MDIAKAATVRREQLPIDSREEIRTALLRQPLHETVLPIGVRGILWREVCPLNQLALPRRARPCLGILSGFDFLQKPNVRRKGRLAACRKTSP